MNRPLGYRIVQFGLKVAARAANDVVDRVMERAPSSEDAPRSSASPVRRGFLSRAPRLPVPVTFTGHPAGVVEFGTTILEASKMLGVELSHYCGGNCSCGTCRVEVLSGLDQLSKRQPREQMALGSLAGQPIHRLACQTRLYGAAEVRVPAWF
jgi:ferredoxin